MRSRLRSGPPRVFSVVLTVHQLDSIPPIHQLLFVQWRAHRAIPSDGRTSARPVEPGNLISWNFNAQFSIPILSDSADHTILQPAPLLLQLRSERRTRWVGHSNQFEGHVAVDLAEVAAVGFLSRNYLVQGSLLNTTLKLSVRVSHRSGDKIFRTRTLPRFTSALLNRVSNSLTPVPTPPNSSTAGNGPPTATDDSDHNSSVDRMSSFDTFANPQQSVPDRLGIALPPLLPSKTSSASIPSLPSKSFRLSPITDEQTHDTPPLFEMVQTPSAVLESSIPDPEEVQKDVYEQIFQQRMRDEWPSHIVHSRFDAAYTVNAIYAAICKADGIGHSPVSDPKTNPSRTKEDGSLCLDHLIESRAELPTPSKQGQLSKHPSNRALSLRSSSASELRDLAT